MCVAGCCRSVYEAIPILQQGKIDLLFLDVKMPQVTGIEFLQEMLLLPDVILTTAYREYAVQAYDYGVLDYLVKPVSFVRFAKAVDRYKQKQGNNDAMQRPVVFKSGYEYHKIIPADILYIQSSKEYVTVVCADNKYLVRGSMNDILLQLPGEGFLQVHKSYIVPVNNIKSVSAVDIHLLDGSKIAVGRSFTKQVRARFADLYM